MSAVGSILTNSGALTALQSIAQTSQTTNQLQNELASGLSINSAADNPAGYITAQGFTSQINGLTQATSNANQGVSLLQTAQSAIGQQISIVQQLNSIAVQSANGTESTSEQNSLQTLVKQLTTQVSTISSQTQFNNVNLLDGSFNTMFQVGAEAGQTITVGIGNTSASAIGMYSENSSNGQPASSGAGATYIAPTTDKATALSINGTSLTGVTATSSAAAIAKAINALNNGVTAVASATNSYAYAVSDTSATGSSFVLKSSASGANGVGVSVSVSAGESVKDLASAINSMTKNGAGTGANGSGKGITASSANGKLVITQGSGRNITIAAPASPGVMTTSITANGTAIKAGDIQQANIQMMSSASFTASGMGGQGTVAKPTPVGATQTTLSDIDVSTQEGAETAMNVIKYALQSLSTQDGNLGAVQQRMTATINNLNSTTTNATTALGVVQDANIPAVANQLTQAQIQAQSGVAALKSSTQLQQTYLSLLP